MKRLLKLIKKNLDYTIIKKSGLFDEQYYLRHNIDVLFSDTDPLKHYLENGNCDNRNPSAEFDQKYYLDKNPDVKNADVNALLHFIKYGKKEGRQPLDEAQNGKKEGRQPLDEAQKGIKKLTESVNKRIKYISSYKKNIILYQKERKLCSMSKRIVVFTAIANNYDSLKLPEILEPEFDYVVFAKPKVNEIGVWQVRNMPYKNKDPVRECRFVKTHPHKLLAEYDIAIWIDSNIMIVNKLYPYVSKFIKSNYVVGAIPHPIRKNIYQEFEACKSLDKDKIIKMKAQIDYYRSINIKHNDLIESNFMMFKLKVPETHNFLNLWWNQIDQYSRRDQLSLNFSLSRNQLKWHKITRYPNSARNHPALAFVPHDQGKGKVSELIEALQKKIDIDIIIPVFNAIDDVKNCLNSLILNQGLFRLKIMVINDASDIKTSSWLNKFCNLKDIALINHPRNLGYTKSVNRGLKLSKSPYVIILNSDTIVTPGWLSAMFDCFQRDSKIGIVGPLSNAASWQSVPELMDKDGFKINRLPQGLTPTDFAKLVQKVSKKRHPKVNVINGFCFMIKREVIDTIGYLDEINFPVGYGEENDYCIRAAKSGFELAIADNAYVYHAKSKSFGHSQRKVLSQKGTEALVRLHGRRQLERLTHNLKQHPVLDKIRQDLVLELPKLKPANK